jgi:hypothetical protein
LKSVQPPLFVEGFLQSHVSGGGGLGCSIMNDFAAVLIIGFVGFLFVIAGLSLIQG